MLTPVPPYHVTVLTGGNSGVGLDAAHPRRLDLGRRPGPEARHGQAGAAVERLVLDPALEGVTGAYFNRQEQAKPRRRAMDLELAGELWDVSARAVGVDPGAPGHGDASFM